MTVPGFVALLIGAGGFVELLTGAPTGKTHHIGPVDEWRIIAGLGMLFVSALFALADALRGDDE